MATRDDGPPTTCVLGLGNVLMGDDGFGPAVVRAFEDEYVVAPDVNGIMVVDVGTPGLDLVPWLADVEHVVIVDTVTTKARPGTICLYDKRDILRHSPFARVSPHDPGLKETLLALEFAGRAPADVALVGVVPAAVEMGLELSPAVRRAVPDAVATVAAILERRGIRIKRRAQLAASPAAVYSPV